MALGQNMRRLLRFPLHVTPSKIMHPLGRWIIFPFLSLMIFSTREWTRKVRPQYGIISTSNDNPRFFASTLRVLNISFFGRTWTRSPGRKFKFAVGVLSPADPRISQYSPRRQYRRIPALSVPSAP